MCVVPAVFVLTAISGVGVAVVEGTAPGFVFRCAGVLAVLIWTLATFIGTVPINAAVLTWRPDAPPENWKAIIKRWERLDTGSHLGGARGICVLLDSRGVATACDSGRALVA